MSAASDQITEYLSVGGLFNPEMMNQTQHEAVRDTLIKARDDIQRLERENAALREAFKSAVILREYEDGRDRIQEYVKKGYLFSGEVVILMNRTAFDAARKEAQP